MNTTNNNTQNSLSASVSKHATRRAMNLKFRTLIVIFASLLSANQIHAANAILVASRYSNSIEQFTTGGTWVRTFATTGRYAPSSIAQSPTTGEIFVTTQLDNSDTSVILRYKPDGTFNVNWDQFKLQCPPPKPPLPYPCFSAATESLLFDAAGNLWVATAYGIPHGDPTYPFSPIYIFKFEAAALTAADPGAIPGPVPAPIIMAGMIRGDQMTFDHYGNLCIAGFLDEDVQCFSASTAALAKSYKAALQAASPVIEPAGVAFDSSNRMYVSSVFTGEVAHETSPGSAIVPLASGLVSAPNLLNGNLTLIANELYVPTFYYPAPPTPSTPDSIDTVSITSGAVSPFISGGAPPLLGNAHMWGAQWVAFVNL